jgi:hypothetical protein
MIHRLSNKICDGEISEEIITLHTKLLKTHEMYDQDKKNRWFGYCQCLGEQLGIWTLEEIINKVKEEFHSDDNEPLRTKNCFIDVDKLKKEISRW